MATLPVYNRDGKQAGTLEVSDRVFGLKPNAALLHQAVQWYQRNRRRPVAHTKTKGEVRGGGIKPWRQKGTGRARTGSIRNPQWRGGGIVHGPRSNRSYAVDLPVAMRRKALAMSLSDKAREQKLIVLDQMLLPEAKTKQMVKLLSALPIQHRSVLVALAKKDRTVERAARNLPKITTSLATSLNAEIVLKHAFLLADQAAVKHMEQTLK